MADQLRTVRTVRNVQNSIEKFESLSLKSQPSATVAKANQRAIIELDEDDEPKSLLTVVSSKSTTEGTKGSDNHMVVVAEPSHKRQDSSVFIQKSYPKEKANSLVDDAREILKSQPGAEDVEAVLLFIQYGIDGRHDFDIRITSSEASLLVHALVTSTLPNLWPGLAATKLSKSDLVIKQILMASLFSLTGISAILEQIRKHSRRALSQDSIIKTYVDFLATLLHGSNSILQLLRDSDRLYEKDVQSRLSWQGIVALIAGSKILSTVASLPADESWSASWLFQGREYTRWLARNIVKASIDIDALNDQAWYRLGQLFRKALMLGYKNDLISQVYSSLLLGQHALWSPLHKLVKDLLPHDQKTVFDCVLNDLAQKYFSASQQFPISSTDPKVVRTISGASALVDGLVAHNEYLLECAIDWVTSPHGSDHGIGLRRALIAVLARSNDNLERILERSLTLFSDKNQIQYMSTYHQEHLAQILLLVIGSLSRQRPEILKQDPVPTLTMKSVSNRLASSVPRTRLLGMVIGVGMSRCVDEPGRVMNFDVEDMETRDVKDMLGLLYVHDRIGALEDLKTIHAKESVESGSKKRKISTPNHLQSPKPTSKIISIEDVPSSSDDEDDLVPYRKPPNDPEDSEEDATLINRNKPKAPIYIVDLIQQLQLPNDKIDVTSLALKSAAGLIRRKAGFGTELSDNAHNLAAALINLQATISRPEQQEQRLEALVACLVACPETLGKYLASTYFHGDLSLSQRSILLTAIGVGARELAGFSDAGKFSYPDETDLFPSERLPSHLEPKPITASSGMSSQNQRNPIAILSNAATHDMIRPLALAAAESQAGPKVLQINRSSSSLAGRNKGQRPQTRKIPKRINSILTDNIYLPLVSPLTAILAYLSVNPSSSGSATLILHPSALTLHLQTLTLVLHTLGPTGLGAPQAFSSLTHETLLLLSSLTRTQLSLDGIVLPALLGLFLALVDITVEIGVVAQERLLGDEFGGVLSELVKWVSALEDSGAPPPTSNEDGRGGGGTAWTVLAAGIQVRWMEIGRRFQGRFLGLEDGDL